MIEIRKNSVLIPLSIWNELKENNYFKEIIEVLEDSELLEKTKRESTGSIYLNDYIRERKKKENRNSKVKLKKTNKKKTVVQN